MLKIQLCPESELENEHWYTYDVLLLVVLSLIGWVAASFWLANLKQETERLNSVASSWEAQIEETQPLINKFNNLDADIALLNKKIEIIKRITAAHPEKVKPIVVLEQLQTLRPDGLWYLTMTLDEADHLHITGASTDSILISEFLLGVRETMNPDTWTDDIRTQIGFETIALKEMKRTQGDSDLKDVGENLTFDFTAEVAMKRRSYKMGSPTVLGPLPRSANGFKF